MNDPVVAAIREAREEYARRFDYEFDQMCDDWQRRQKEPGVHVVTLPKRAPLDNSPLSEIRTI